MTIRITPFDTLNYHPGSQQANPIFKSPFDDHNQGQEVINPNFDPEFDLNDGLVSEQKKSRRRLKLERSIEILKSVEIPGRVHAIQYLEHQYRWNRHWRTLQNNRISSKLSISSGSKRYLKHHLAIAGVDRNLFDATAVTAIHQGSGGLFRKANHLARGGLIAAAAEKSSLVCAEHIRLAATEIF